MSDSVRTRALVELLPRPLHHRSLSLADSRVVTCPRTIRCAVSCPTSLCESGELISVPDSKASSSAILLRSPATAWCHRCNEFEPTRASTGISRNGTGCKASVRSVRVPRRPAESQGDVDPYLDSERVGFEPTERSSRSAVFKTAAFNHSATSPILIYKGFRVSSYPEKSLFAHRLLTSLRAPCSGV
jgi:hypothetical protein